MDVSRRELLAEYQKKMRGAGSSSGGTSLNKQWNKYQVREGTHNIRILPSPDGKLSWRDVAFHYFGFQKGNKQFICPNVTLNQPCPICERWAELRFSKVDADKKLGKIFSPKSCRLFWVIDRENEKEGPMIWTASYSPSTQILEYYMNADWENLDDPVDGNDMAVNYEVIQNAPNKYNIQPRKPAPVFVNEKTNEYDEEKYKEVISKTFPLSECYTRSRSYEELKSILAVFEAGEDVNKFVVAIDEEKKKNRKDSTNGAGSEESDETSESSEEEQAMQKPATIDVAPVTKSEAPVVVLHEPICIGEYDAKDIECQIGKCDNRKACMKKTGTGSGEKPVRDLMSGGGLPTKSNATTSLVDTKVVTVHGTSSLLEKAMAEARGKKKV